MLFFAEWYNVKSSRDKNSYATFFYKPHFHKQHQVEIGKKKQAKTKQHQEAGLLVFKNCSISSTALSSKNNFGEITKKVQKTSTSIYVRLYN